MAIGKAAIALFAFLIGAMALLSIFAIAHEDKSDAAYYMNESNSVNKTIPMAEGVTGAVVGYITPISLVAAIMFFGAVIMIFSKRKG